jgi:hypothetical protein
MDDFVIQWLQLMMPTKQHLPHGIFCSMGLWENEQVYGEYQQQRLL